MGVTKLENLNNFHFMIEILQPLDTSFFISRKQIIFLGYDLSFSLTIDRNLSIFIHIDRGS